MSYAEINLKNLTHNYELIQKSIQPGAFVCAMVKANAYGHDDLIVSRQLEKIGAQNLGVVTLDEALHLRQGGIRANVMLFGIFRKNDVGEILQHHICPVLSTWEQVEALQKAITQKPLDVHLKFDTGMQRMGFPLTEAAKLVEFFKQNKQFLLKGILTHFVNSEDLGATYGTSYVQLDRFKKVMDLFKDFNCVFHAMNSAAILNYRKIESEFPLFGARPGLLLYGINPMNTQVDSRPVMSFRSPIALIKKVPKGESVSYGPSWVARRDSQIAVVPMGYADGLHRVLSNKGEVLFGKTRVPMVGTVCMDYFMLDITDVIDGQLVADPMQQEVTIFGVDPTGKVFNDVKVLAEKAGTVSWELLTNVGPRVRRKIHE